MRVLLLIFFILLSSVPTFSQDEEPEDKAYDDGFFNLLIGRYAEAEENFTQAIEEKDRLQKAYYFRSKARCGQGDFENALIDINESLELAADDNSSLDMRGKIYLALDRPKEALPDFKRIFDSDPEFEKIHFYLGRTYFKLDLFETAILQFDQALIQDPDDSKTYRLRGLSNLILENDEQACNDISRARKMGEPGLDKIMLKYCGDIELDPENIETEYDWSFYDDPDIIDGTNASVFMDFSTDDPESMVKYFYASRIRGDEKWKDVLQHENQWTDRLKYSLNKYEKWNFVNFHLVKKKRHSNTGWWIMVYFEIEVNGEKDGGNDEVSLEFNGTEWVITEVPN